MIKVKPGDTVQIECMTSMGTGGPEKVTKVTREWISIKSDGLIATKVSRRTVIWCGKRAFDAKDGSALNKPTMYYIEE